MALTKKAKEIEKAAKEFAAFWQGKGYEKGQSQAFWLELLQKVFGLESGLMLCAPDCRRGERLLKLALSGGNFGQYKTVPKPKNVFVRWFKDRMRALSWLTFDPVNAFFKELKYWRATISLIPKRIKRRRIAL